MTDIEDTVNRTAELKGKNVYCQKSLGSETRVGLQVKNLITIENCHEGECESAGCGQLLSPESSR